MKLKLPERPACEVDWSGELPGRGIYGEAPSPETLWLKTLNVFERDMALEAADLFAHRLTRRYRGPEGDGYLLLRDRFSALSAEEQAVFLAESGLLDGSVAGWAAEQCPDPQPPSPTWSTPSDSAHYLSWEEGCRAAVARRADLIRSRYDEVLAASLALSAPERLERCCLEAWVRRHRELRGFRLICETLFIAARHNDCRTARYFPSVDTIMLDMSDADREALWGRYQEMQLPSCAVPTWAAVSQA
jgi:hypothetical protein